MSIRISPKILATLRSAAKANSYAELEDAGVLFPQIRAICALFVEAHERAVERAAERKEARRWKPTEDEILRLGFREGQTVGQLAARLERTPLTVKNRLAALGLLKIANIRRAPLQQTNTSQEPRSTPTQSPNPTPAGTPRIVSGTGSIDSREDEMMESHFDLLAREQAEAARAEEEEFQTRLEEWQEAADAQNGEDPSEGERAA